MTTTSFKDFWLSTKVIIMLDVALIVFGVDVQTGGGQPGTGAQIRIRGGASLSASNDPLYVKMVWLLITIPIRV